MNIYLIALTCLVARGVLGYSYQITVSSQSSQSITNFNVDLAACSCDISAACDAFCCCDAQCSADKIALWTASTWCYNINNAVDIEKYCDKVGVKGTASFEDLGCVVFSNRGSIGTFYNVPSVNNVVDPNVPKFATRTANAQTIQQYSIPNQVSYQQNSALRAKIGGTASYLFVWLPSMGQCCRKSYIPITQGTKTYECVYPVNADTCSLANNNIAGLVQICSLFDCSSIAFLSNNVPISSYTSGTCNNMITNTQLQITLDYVNSQYKVASGRLNFNTNQVTGKKAIITTTISIKKSGTERSGKPGYIIGKPIQYSSPGIYEIADNNQFCLSASTTNLLNIKFGVNETFFCFTSTACPSNLYVDQVPLASSYKFLKYASISSDQVNTTGLSSASCKAQSYTLYMLYSYSGWVVDPQYYIIGSTFVAQNIVSNPTMKQLNIKWIKVEPSQVTTPPSNNFYKYFQKLWLPLKSTFYQISAQFYYKYMALLSTCLIFVVFIIF